MLKRLTFFHSFYILEHIDRKNDAAAQQGDLLKKPVLLHFNQRKFLFPLQLVEKLQLNIQLREGNPAAYEMLFKQTFPRLLGYCRLFVHDQASANDLVQECYVRLWEKRATISSGQSVESLLFVMLRNRCLNFLRDQKSDFREQDIGFIPESELQHLYQLDFTGREERTVEEKLIESIRTAVSQLPEKRRLVFTKAKIEGKKNKEVAEELGISVKAVEKHLHQAKEQIREEMLQKFPMLAIIIVLLMR